MTITPDEIKKGRALADLAGVDESSIIRKALDAAEKLTRVKDCIEATYGGAAWRDVKECLESDKVAP